LVRLTSANRLGAELLGAHAVLGDFHRWLATAGERGAASRPTLQFLRMEDEGALVLGVTRPQEAQSWATICITSVEGASFFIEGLEDPPDEVEDWLTAVNSYVSEKARLSLGDALEAALSKIPSATVVGPSRLGRSEEDGDCEEEEEYDDLIADEDLAVGQDRTAQREAYQDEARWNSLATSSAQQGSRQASQVLMREMRNLMSLKGDGEGQQKALEIEMVEDSLYRWTVQMHADGFPENCPLRSELCRFGAQHSSRKAAIVMDVHFPNTYPMEPPFIRVVRPRFLMHTGHITIGGSVCMQLLTPSGWLPSVSLENVFVAIRSEMIEGGGRIDFSPMGKRDYTMAEAEEAFKRVASRYGWLMTSGSR